MTCNTCTPAGCRQGRDCTGSTDASRAAIGLRPLGGGNYHPEHTEEPALWSPTVLWLIASAALVIVTGIAAACGLNVVCPFA